MSAELKRFILVQYHHGQTTVPRLVELLGMLGLDVSERQVVRILTEGKALYLGDRLAITPGTVPRLDQLVAAP